MRTSKGGSGTEAIGVRRTGRARDRCAQHSMQEHIGARGSTVCIATHIDARARPDARGSAVGCAVRTSKGGSGTEAIGVRRTGRTRNRCAQHTLQEHIGARGSTVCIATHIDARARPDARGSVVGCAVRTSKVGSARSLSEFAGWTERGTGARSTPYKSTSAHGAWFDARGSAVGCAVRTSKGGSGTEAVGVRRTGRARDRCAQHSLQERIGARGLPCALHPPRSIRWFIAALSFIGRTGLCIRVWPSSRICWRSSLL